MTRVFFICVTGVPVILKEFDLTGKVAIVTGAARREGSARSRSWNREAADVKLKRR